MGRSKYTRISVVDIEGDAPTEKELDTFKRVIELKVQINLRMLLLEELTESYIQSPHLKTIS